MSVTTPASSTATSEVEAAPRRSAVPAPPPMLVGRAVVDVAGRAVVRTLTKDAFGDGAAYGSTLYHCVGRWAAPPKDERIQELHAYDLATGKLRWSKPVAHCRDIAAGAAGVLVGRYSSGAPGATFYDGAKGTSREVAPGRAVIAVHAFGAGFIALHEDGVLDALDGASLAVRGTVKLPFVPTPFELGSSFVERGAELCAAEGNGVDVHALCIDAALGVRFSLHENLGGSSYVRERGARWAVAATTQGNPQSLVIDLDAGKVAARVGAEVAATVRNEADDLDGLLVTRPSTQLLDRSGHVQWNSPEPLGEAARALSKDGMIFVASHDRMAAGASLIAFDAKTGAVRWRGDLKLAQDIVHSIYRNRVELDFDHGVLAIRGYESSQEYFELIAPADGAPLFRVVQKR
ncbi:Hypothetical protein A7982_04953 [Minicystis rosea]|nr:Hypothetical protein A7982_04953 [Minicystis rosea]